MTVADVSYLVRPYRPSDEPQVLRLLERSLAGGPTGRRSEEFFRWKHVQNPFGPSVALVAEEEGQLIGFRTFMRWRFRVGDRTVDAARAVDTATHPDHQRRGIFTRLTMAAIDEIGDQAQLIFNTPNQKSLPGYLKMGWQRVGTVPVAIRPVHPLRFVRGLPRVDRGAPTGPPPNCNLPLASQVLSENRAAIEGLLAGSSDPSRMRTDRSVAYLRWRYLDPPGLRYHGVAIRGDGGELRGLALGRPRWRGSLGEFVLSEILVRPGDGPAARRLLRYAARSGLDHVAVHLASRSSRRAGRVAGYVAVPRVGMTLTCRPLAHLSPDPTDLDSWDLSLGDLEVM